MPLDLLKQLMLPGMRALRGVERIPGKPGMWKVEPSELSEKKWLDRAQQRLDDEVNMAEYDRKGVPSISGKENARSGNMLLGALNELRYASMLPKGPSAKATKGIVYVDKNGNVRAGAALNTEKARDYLADDFDLDFTKKYPNYLEYVSTTTPDAKGSDILRELQKLYGDEMVFQVANPKKNVPIYEAMGAERMPLRIDGGDVLGGGHGLPAFELKQRIPERRVAPELVGPPRQGDFGFRKGGLARIRWCHG